MKKVIYILILFACITFNVMSKPLYNKNNFKGSYINITSLNMVQNMFACNNLRTSILNQISMRDRLINECSTNKRNCLNNYNIFMDCNYNILQNLIGITCNTERNNYLNSCNNFHMSVELVRNIDCNTHGIGDGRDICINFFDYNDRHCQVPITLPDSIRDVCLSYN